MILLLLAALAAQDHRYKPFGPEGELTPAMLSALHRMSEAGRVPERRDSMNHFRWSGTPPKLTHVGLWGSKATNEIVGLTAALPDLAFLSVYEGSLDDEGAVALTRIPGLRYLSITRVERYEKAGYGPTQWSRPFIPRQVERPRLTGKGLRVLTSVRSLEGLDLMDARLTSADLAALRDWPKLGSVSLPLVIDDAVVEHLKACPRLSRLTLGHRTVDASELKRLAAWPGLRSLTLAVAELPDETLQALAALPQLQTVELFECGLTDDRLGQVRLPERLAALSLSRNEIAGPGLESLSVRPKTLDLTFNNLSDATLSTLTRIGPIEELRIAYCRAVTDEGIRSGVLQELNGLKKLELRGLPKVTDASLASLEKLSGLTNLGIRETKISVDGWKRLQAAMPRTVVFK